jgi:hypothetical protein
MDFVQILYAGFSNFDDTNVPAKGMQFSTYAGFTQSHNVNPIEDFHQKKKKIVWQFNFQAY